MNVWDGSNMRKVTIEDGLKSNVAFNIYQDKDMILWVPTDKGITQIRELQNSNGEWIFKLKNIETQNQKNYNTTDIIETKKGELYVYLNFV
jgi:ligand-binding sensor domain-containing protein